jgi:hypothetical protein
MGANSLWGGETRERRDKEETGGLVDR